MTDDRQKRLIEAVNLICDEVSENLPPEWSIELTMDCTEASISLVDPDGNHVEFSCDGSRSAISVACDQAREDLLADADSTTFER